MGGGEVEAGGGAEEPHAGGVLVEREAETSFNPGGAASGASIREL